MLFSISFIISLLRYIANLGKILGILHWQNNENVFFIREETRLFHLKQHWRAAKPSNHDVTGGYWKLDGFAPLQWATHMG